MSGISRHATTAEIIEIVGPLDDAVLMRIVETEATAAEVLEAFTWTTADDQIGKNSNAGPAVPSPGSMKSSSAKSRKRTSANHLDTENGK